MEPGYFVRPPTEADAECIANLIFAAERAVDPAAKQCASAELLREWEELDLARDAWLVIDQGGSACGFATVLARPSVGVLYGDAYTHPDHAGRGIGCELLHRIDDRAAQFAAEPRDTRIVLVNYAPVPSAAQLLLQHGYRTTRVHHHMYINIDHSSPGRPTLEALPGIHMRTCDGSDADLRLAHACIEDAFADHWGRTRRTFEEWTRHMVYDGFDPALWLLAEEGGRVVGAALCRIRGAVGEVDQLGVLRPARRRGLGRELLVRSFEMLRTRQATRVVLTVDSASPTGADRLYERAGMRVSSRVARFEKEIRPGRDLLEESIAAARSARTPRAGGPPAP